MDKRFKEQLIITAIVFITPIIGAVGYVYYLSHQIHLQDTAQQNLKRNVPLDTLLAEADQLMASTSQTDAQSPSNTDNLMEKINPTVGKSDYPTIQSLAPIDVQMKPEGLVLEINESWGVIIGREGQHMISLNSLAPDGTKVKNQIADRIVLYSKLMLVP